MSTPENDTNEALAEERVSAEAAAEVDVVVAEGTDADVAEGTDADAAATEDVISDDAENSDEAAPADERLALELTDVMTRDIQVPDALFERVRGIDTTGLSDADRLDQLLLVRTLTDRLEV